VKVVTVLEWFAGVIVIACVVEAWLRSARRYRERWRYVTKGPEKDVKRGATECVGRVG
jgi:hypothetical protein